MQEHVQFMEKPIVTAELPTKIRTTFQAEILWAMMSTPEASTLSGC